jgi:hypothetical protein
MILMIKRIMKLAAPAGINSTAISTSLIHMPAKEEERKVLKSKEERNQSQRPNPIKRAP